MVLDPDACKSPPPQPSTLMPYRSFWTVVLLALITLAPGCGDEQFVENGFPDAGLTTEDSVAPEEQNPPNEPREPQEPERADEPIENDPEALGVLLNEVFLDESQIELHNRGTKPLDLSGFWLCHTTPGLIYFRLPENTVVGPQDFLVVHWGIAGTDTATEIFSFPAVPLPLNREDGEIALFTNFGDDKSNFSKSEHIRDYVQWGAGAHFRESVAVEAGIWRLEGSVPLPGPGRSLAFVGRGDIPEGWPPSIPSIGATNVTP